MSPANDDSAPGGAAPAPSPLPGQVWDDWPPSTSPLLTEFPGKADISWTLAGRRASVCGTAHGLSMVELDGRPVAAEIRLEVEGQPPEVVAVRVAPDEVVRVLQAGEVQLTERVTTALEQPLVFWSFVADGAVSLRVGWRAGLEERDPGSEVMTEAREPGGVILRRPHDGLVALAFAAAGEVRPDGATLVATGERLLRLVLLAGEDEPALERWIETLRRRKLRAFRQDRILHARRLEERLVTLESPDPMLDRRFGWAKVELDARLEERPGLGRRVSREPFRTARALLAAGDREVVRDLIHGFTAGPEGTPADSPLLAVIEAYLRWTGDLELLAQGWSRVADLAGRDGARLAPVVRDGLAAAARAAGAGELAERLAVTPASGPMEPAPHIELTGFGADPAGLVSGVVETLWGLAPDLIRGEVRVAPALPRGWTEMALRRVRVGPTFFDLRLRRRPERTVLAVRRASGPPIRLRTSLRDDAARGPITVDQVELGGREASFLVEDVHEVAFHDG